MTEEEAWKKFGSEIRTIFAKEIKDTVGFLLNGSPQRIPVERVKIIIEDAFVQGVICKIMRPSGPTNN